VVVDAPDAAPPGPSWDAVAYRTAIEEGIEALLAADPVNATEEGDHRFDDQLPDISEAAQLKAADDFSTRAQGLRTIAQSVPADASTDAPRDAGTDHPALDANLLAGRFETLAFTRRTFRPFERDPSSALVYVGRAIVSITDHDYAPKHARMDALATRLAKIPALLDVARGRVKGSSHASLENLAVIGKGLGAMLRGPAVAEWTKNLDADAPLQARLKKGADDAANAIAAYVASVDKAFPLAKAKDEPIGAEMWGKLAQLFEGVTDSPADVRAMGEKELARLEAELDALIKESGKKGETRAAFFDRLQKDTPPMDGVLDEYKAVETRVDQWMHDRPVVTVPWNQARLEIVPTPPHQRGTSFASMNVAGPLEPSITDARLEVNNPLSSMPAAQRNALLRFNAKGAIDLVVIHEAIPGHYLQGLYIRSGVSRVRKLLWTSTLGEGWAHYCEEMAYENGYPAPDPVRMHAFYLRMALQRAVRVIIDVGENDGSLTLAQGAKYLVDHALLAPESAKIEARRAVVSPANMFTYTYGKLAILKLRDAVKAKEGDSFDLRRFHDRLLSVGPMPVGKIGEVAFGLK
jgi:uncharacterized protein (DUF885 family)